MSLEKKCLTAFALAVALCGMLALSVAPPAQAQEAPHYKLDGNWPKPLPMNWTIMGVTGMFVDKEQ